MATVILNASQLLTLSGPAPRRGPGLSSLGLVESGAVLVEGGVILAAGPRDQVMRHPQASSARIIDAGKRVILPGFVDSHSHPVFASPRLDDFESRIRGKTYARMAEEGGGILSTVAGVRAASQAELARGLRERARKFLEAGTTTLEAKSGYGLSVEDELKMLRAIKSASGQVPLEILPTLIGAHAFPAEMEGRREEYVRQVCEEMIPAAARESLAAFVDIFCEKGFFTLEETQRIFQSALKAGLRTKIHAEQISRTGSAALAARAAAVSADHLDCAVSEDVQALAGSRTVACLVPGSNYFLGKPYPPARALIDGGAAVALATDFNPGTCPCWDMRQILSIACTQMKMSPAEVLAAATINGACALGLEKSHGSLEPGKKADILCYEAQDYREIPYYFGNSAAAWVMKAGTVVFSRESLRP